MKLFGKWENKAEISDPGLAKYINIKDIYVPHSHGRAAKYRFGKSKMHIVERLINKITIVGHKGKKHWRTSEFKTGKKFMATDIIKNAFEIIEKRTKRNPIEVLVKAVENSAPREEVTTIEVGGVRVPKQVDISPQRRVDLALRWITQGAYQKSVKNVKIEKALAEEIINAYENNNKSFAISKKIEVERQAAASK